MKNNQNIETLKFKNLYKNQALSLRLIRQEFFNFKMYKIHNWFHFLLLIINAFVPFFEIALAITTALQENNAVYIWFTNWDTFTHQTNFIVFIFVWISFWKPKSKVFKTNDFLLWTMTYIFITTLFFNVFVIVLAAGFIGYFDNSDINNSTIPSVVSNHIPYKPQDDSSLAIFNATSSIWFHVINPWIFIVYGLLLIFLDNKTISKCNSKYLLLGMIYPVIYMAYLIYIPWSGFNDNGQNSYSVYSIFTQTKYNNKTWLWFYPLFFIFPIVAYFLRYLNKLGGKLKSKKDKKNIIKDEI